MTDKIDSKYRSWVMSRIRSGDTKPEIIVRSLLHRCGYRFVIKSKKLPGKPDIVLPKYKVAIFTHGCFWHRHGVQSCNIWKIPKSNTEFWVKKLSKNVERDEVNANALKEAGWHVLTIWECEVEKSPMVVLKYILFELEIAGGNPVEECIRRLGVLADAIKNAKYQHKVKLHKVTGQKSYDD